MYQGLATLSTVEHVENLVTAHKTAETSQLLVKVRLVKMTGPGTRNDGMNSNYNLKREARSEVCVFSMVKRRHRTLMCPGVHLTQRATKKTMRDCRGKPVKYVGAKY